MALGRGLDALLGDAALQTQEGGSVVLPIRQVEPGLNQPRKNFDEEALAELAESIRQHGILQPLYVRPMGRRSFRALDWRRWSTKHDRGTVGGRSQTTHLGQP